MDDIHTSTWGTAIRGDLGGRTVRVHHVCTIHCYRNARYEGAKPMNRGVTERYVGHVHGCGNTRAIPEGVSVTLTLGCNLTAIDAEHVYTLCTGPALHTSSHSSSINLRIPQSDWK